MTKIGTLVLVAIITAVFTVSFLFTKGFIS